MPKTPKQKYIVFFPYNSKSHHMNDFKEAFIRKYARVSYPEMILVNKRHNEHTIDAIVENDQSLILKEAENENDSLVNFGTQPITFEHPKLNRIFLNYTIPDSDLSKIEGLYTKDGNIFIKNKAISNLKSSVLQLLKLKALGFIDSNLKYSVFSDDMDVSGRISELLIHHQLAENIEFLSEENNEKKQIQLCDQEGFSHYVNKFNESHQIQYAISPNLAYININENSELLDLFHHLSDYEKKYKSLRRIYGKICDKINTMEECMSDTETQHISRKKTFGMLPEYE